MRVIWVACFALILSACASVPPVAEKRIALTFDDIPRSAGAFLSPDERTVRLIAALDAAGVDQAAFFLNPGNIPERAGAEDHIAAYVAAGHVIANHSHTHPHLSDLTAADYLADIDAAMAALEGRGGYRAWFRYPYLDEGQADTEKRDAVRAGLAQRGLLNGGVTVDASDWFYEQATIDAVAAGKAIDMDALRDLYVESHVQSAEFNYDLARRTLGRSPAHVMLLHETDLAALYIGDLVAALRAAGWQIVSADAAFADPIYRATPDTAFAQGTVTEQLAWEAGLPAPRWYARNDTELAGRLFAERVLGEAIELQEEADE